MQPFSITRADPHQSALSKLSSATPAPSVSSLVTSPISPGLLSQLLLCLGSDLLLTVISAVLSSGDGRNRSCDPSSDLAHQGDPEPFPLPSLCPKRCYSVARTSLAVALQRITCPLDMLAIGCVSVVMSLKPYNLGFLLHSCPSHTAYGTCSCSNNRQFSWWLPQFLINGYVSSPVLPCFREQEMTLSTGISLPPFLPTSCDYIRRLSD